MAELKTKQTDASVTRFLESIPDKVKRDDAAVVIELMKQATKAEPKLWGPSIIGFGEKRLRYDSGRELDWFVVGFSPRKQALVLYSIAGRAEAKPLLADLGKFKTGKGCLYINKLEDIHLPTLKKLVQMAAAS